MNAPVLHGYFRSSAAYRVRIAIGLKGLPHENVYRHLRRNEHLLPEYLALNPEGLLPALVLGDGPALAQSMAIIEYLDETNPEPPLMPSDPLGRARVRGIAQAVSCDIHPINNLRVLQRLRQQFGADEDAVNAWARHWIVTGFDGLERRLAAERETGAFCHGDRPTLADICLVPQAGSAQRFGVDLGAYPTIRRIAEACGKIEAFDRARPDKQPDAE